MKRLLQKFNLVLILAIFLILAFGVSKVSAVNLKLTKVQRVSVKKQSTSSITISWEKVNKASGYKVYIYNTSKNKYECYKTTNKTKFEIKNLKSAIQYKIKIRAYKKLNNKKYYGKYSSVLKASTTPEKVKNIKAKSVSTNSITISWNKVSRVTGYKVYVYNTSNNKYEYYGKTKSTKITIKKLKTSKQYQIRVRAYKTLNSKQYFGSYSSILKVKTKSGSSTTKLSDAQKNTILQKYIKAENNYLVAKNNTIKLKKELTDLQYSLSNQQLVVKDAQVKLKYAQECLKNVENERTVKIFINGTFQWIADPQQVAKAQQDIGNAQSILDKENLKLEKINLNISTVKVKITNAEKLEKLALDEYNKCKRQKAEAGI